MKILLKNWIFFIFNFFDNVCKNRAFGNNAIFYHIFRFRRGGGISRFPPAYSLAHKAMSLINSDMPYMAHLLNPDSRLGLHAQERFCANLYFIFSFPFGDITLKWWHFFTFCQELRYVVMLFYDLYAHFVANYASCYILFTTK